MSDMTYQVSVGAAVAADPSIVNLSAVSADAVLDTDQGEVLAGDVTTMHRLRVIDGGLLPIRWITHLNLDRDFLHQYPDLQPVFLENGMLAPNVPTRDAYLSAQTMVWTDETCDAFSVYGAAHMLGDLVCQPKPAEEASYIVISLSRPAMFRADGMWVSCG